MTHSLLEAAVNMILYRYDLMNERSHHYKALMFIEVTFPYPDFSICSKFGLMRMANLTDELHQLSVAAQHFRSNIRRFNNAMVTYRVQASDASVFSLTEFTRLFIDSFEQQNILLLMCDTEIDSRMIFKELQFRIRPAFVMPMNED